MHDTANNAPPITLTPHFIDAPEQLFSFLKKYVVWDERMRARKTASFGVAYDYSQIAYPETSMPPALEAICARLAKALGFHPNNCLLNYYLDGDASMGFHSDSSENLLAGTGVAIISLGSERPIVFRNKLDKLVRASYPMLSGSLLYMSQQMQLDWLHAIPKAPGAGERISLTFRAIEREVRGQGL